MTALQLLNKKFGSWTVIERFHTNTKYRKTQWVCECICGSRYVVTGVNLKYGLSTKCKPCADKTNIVPNNIVHWDRIKRDAKERNFEFNIKKEKCYNLLVQQNFKCALSGVTIYLAKTAAENRICLSTASLDRINSNKGYTMDNIQWVHKDINVMKMNYDQQYFLDLCKKVYEHNFVENLSVNDKCFDK